MRIVIPPFSLRCCHLSVFIFGASHMPPIGSAMALPAELKRHAAATVDQTSRGRRMNSLG